MGSKEIDPRVNRYQAGARLITSKAGDKLFPTEVIEVEDGVKRVESLAEEGYGIVFVFNHFSHSDPLRVGANLIYKSSILRERTIVAPVAYHHSRNKWLEVARVMHGVQSSPVVTPRTVELGKHDGLRTGHGSLEYLNLASNILDKGGIVIIAPQATRQESLDAGVESRALEFLVRKLNKENVENVAFLFIGVDALWVEDYSKEENIGFNYWKGYELKTGRALTKDELIIEAGGDTRNIDRVALREIAGLVSESYRGDMPLRES